MIPDSQHRLSISTTEPIVEQQTNNSERFERKSLVESFKFKKIKNHLFHTQDLLIDI